MPMNVLPRSRALGAVTLFSAGVVGIFLRFKGTQNLGLYAYCSLGEQSRDITMVIIHRQSPLVSFSL